MAIKSESSIAKIITDRVSVPQGKMTGPAVNKDHLLIALQSAMSAPDHGGLKPFRFAIAVHENAQKFYKAFVEYSVSKGKPRDRVEKAFAGVQAYIFVFTEIQESGVPEYEQEWTTACATQNMLNVLYDYGYACKWNSIYKQSVIDNPHLLGANTPENWIPMGYVMVGHADAENFAPKERADVRDYTYTFGEGGVGDKFFP